MQMWLNTSMSWLAAGPPTCTWPSPHPGISSRMSRRCCWPCPPWRRWRSGGSIPAPLLHTNRTDPLAATGLEQSAAHSGAGGGMGGRGAAKTLEEGRHQDAPCPSLKPLPKILHSFCILPESDNLICTPLHHFSISLLIFLGRNSLLISLLTMPLSDPGCMPIHVSNIPTGRNIILLCSVVSREI